MKKITPFLWYENQAEDAARFYVSLFKNSRITNIQRIQNSGPDENQEVLVINFELDGLELGAFNGGPYFKLNEAASLSVSCENQAEVDRLWAALSAGGEEQQCGWLKDRFGLSWQIVPARMEELMQDPDPVKVGRVTHAMLGMVKLDIAELERAYRGD
ncbi:MAG TPA: VOC family protein [Anaerolineaceae bacterium]|nr:VOC family protein [Anaerolineaceae bacterium]